MEAKIIPFRSAYSGQERKRTEPGRMMQDNYGYEIDKYGRKILVKQGETNLYEIIQESLEETKIENILKRVAMGDTSVMRPDGIYADMTQAPSNLIEARKQMQKLENLWNGLDNEIKRKYNFSVEEFIGASGNENWLRDMGLLKENQPNQTEEQSKQIKEGAKENE